jgi:ribosomal protein L11 methyltransferase
MNNPFSQKKVAYKLLFRTVYKNIVLFEQFFPEDILGLSMYEIESQTIDAMPDDIWQIEAYVADEISLSLLKDQLTHFIKNENISLISEITSEAIEDKDWVAEYQKQQKPIEIGRFLFGSEMNLKDTKANNKVPVYLGASGAFGTGDHETTAGCIQAMEFLSANHYKNIFDIGTGSGILSLAAEKIWPDASIIACDIEEASIGVAQINRDLNNSKVTFYVNKEDDLLIPGDQAGCFDLIVSNILAGPLIDLAPVIKAISHDKTRIILSGFLDYQKDDVSNAYKEIGFEVEKLITNNSWVILLLKPRVS